jgi:phosphohistidine phosphatase
MGRRERPALPDVRSKPDYWYAQSAVVPYRERGGTVEVLMVTSRRRRRWVIPKGIREPDLSAPDSAAKEAREEAGAVGPVDPGALGVYRYEKWGGVCEVEVFSMRVSELLPRWPEDFRERQWVSLDTARARVREEGLRRIIESLPATLAARGQPGLPAASASAAAARAGDGGER